MISRLMLFDIQNQVFRLDWREAFWAFDRVWEVFRLSGGSSLTVKRPTGNQMIWVQVPATTPPADWF